jgi:protein gp37
MAVKSSIEWTDSTWNAIRGCTPVSPGCKNCYASSVAKRFSGPGLPYEGLVRINAAGERTDDWNGTIKFVEKHLLDPLKWKTPKRIFVNSMSDLFHENVSDEVRDKIFAVMALCPQHTFQILTKRPQAMLNYVLLAEERVREIVAFYSDTWGAHKQAEALGGKWISPQRDSMGRVELEGYFDCIEFKWPMSHVMLGASAENQKYYDERIEDLRIIHDAKWTTFLSLEPLLGPINVEYSPSYYPDGPPMCCNGTDCGCRGLPVEPPMVYAADWVIVGGESGHDARPMQSSWASDIQRACARWNIPYFFKQQGMWVDAGHEEFGKLPAGRMAYYDSQGNIVPKCDPRLADENADVTTMKWVGRKRAGKTLYGKRYHEFPA